MKNGSGRKVRFWRSMFFIALWPSSMATGHAADTPGLQLGTIWRGFPLFSIKKTNAPSVQLESSADLKTWQPQLSIYSQLDSLYVKYHDEHVTQGHRLYRAAHPAPSAAQKQTNWRALRIRSYQYDYEYAEFGYSVQGTVTVADGSVVGVANPIVYVDWKPVENPSSSHFKTLEQLFELIEPAISEAELVTVRFDETSHFPSRIAIDYWVGPVDDERYIRALNFRPLP